MAVKRYAMVLPLILALVLPAAALAASGWMGVGLADITADKVSKLKLKEERGVEITSVTPDSPAAQAGLKASDVILEFNGTRVEGIEQLSRLVRETPAGRTVRLLISRDGATQTAQVKLGERKGPAMVVGPREFEFRMPKIEIPEFRVNPEMGTLMMKTSRLGIEGQTLNKQLGEYFGVAGGEGVLVASVDKDSPADKAGVKAGDVIIKVDNEKVANMRDLRNALQGSKTNVQITLIRNKREMTVTANVERSELRQQKFFIESGRTKV